MRKRKKRSHPLACLLALCALLQMGFASPAAFAATTGASATGGYTYSITIYSGDQGTFGDGRTVASKDGLQPGDRVVFDVGDVQPKDDKYYVKGIRKSGRDNNDRTGAVEASAIAVTEDEEYVVAYGVKGETVAYTANYRDGDGNELAPSRVYYGNVGDKPVVAYRHIDGYQPQSYNLTKTLSGNEAENVFTFVYRKTAQATPESGGTGTDTNGQTGTNASSDGGTANGGTGGGTGSDGNGTDGNNAAAAGNNAAGNNATGNNNAAAPVTAVPDDGTPAAEGPEELTDLDDGDAPLANGDLDAQKTHQLRQAAAAIGIAALVIACALAIWLRKKKREGRQGAEAEGMAEEAAETVGKE